MTNQFKRKYATTSEAAIRACADQGMTTPETAKALGISVPSLRCVAGVLGISFSGYRRAHNEWTQEALDAIVSRMQRGESLAEQFEDKNKAAAASKALRDRGMPASVTAAVKALYAKAA